MPYESCEDALPKATANLFTIVKQQHFLLLVTIAVCRPISSSGATYPLFVNGHPNANYHKLINDLNPGDLVTFSDGATFALATGDSVLKGPSCIFLRIGTHQLLRLNRIPKNMKPYKDRLLGEFLDGYRGLANEGVPVPKVWPSLRGEYVLEEAIPVQILLSDWLRNAKSVDKKAKALRLFLLQTWRFTHIGDFRTDQVGWDGHRWVLLDWTSDHIMYDPGAEIQTSVVWRVTNEASRPIQEYLDSVDKEIINLRQAHSTCEEILGDSLFFETQRAHRIL